MLLHQRQIDKLAGGVDREGMTIVPLKLYFNERGRAKLEIALAKGKKLHDKRETLKKRSWEREKGRLLRRCTTSAKRLKNARGSARKAGCCGRRGRTPGGDVSCFRSEAVRQAK